MQMGNYLNWIQLKKIPVLETLKILKIAILLIVHNPRYNFSSNGYTNENTGFSSTSYLFGVPHNEQQIGIFNRIWKFCKK